MDDKKKCHSNKNKPQKNRLQQLQTHNVPSDDVENTNSTN